MISISPQRLSFPRNFAWGFATAAPQIEGAAFADGKGPSIWDTFARQPGRVHHGDTPEHACEHYSRYQEDIALMAQLGAKNYRFSIAWPRIYPHGHGAVNSKGLAFYDRLIDTLLEQNITPWVTMFHWDLPQALEDAWGGWRDRRTADAFALYADTIVRAYGDRVKHWITLNEIYCFTTLGYGLGQKAPGLRLSAREVNQTYHTALLCHGHGVRAVREHGGSDARVGLVDNSMIDVPIEETSEHIAAARISFTEKNIRVLDPIYRGGYSHTYHSLLGQDAATYQEQDFSLISQSTDFLGMNIYTAGFVRASAHGRPEVMAFPRSYPQADASWLKIVPQSIYWGPRLAAEIYGISSIVITENGAGYDDLPPVHGEVHDLHRRDLVRNYLKEVHRAIGDGVPIHGYFLWSFIDNFEWEDGYDRRFGVVYCDFKTQKRTPKTSARWFARVMAENALV